jgi:hypothetical protein
MIDAGQRSTIAPEISFGKLTKVVRDLPAWIAA